LRAELVAELSEKSWQIHAEHLAEPHMRIGVLAILNDQSGDSVGEVWVGATMLQDPLCIM